MATKPSTLPLWATDTNLASGSQSGQTTKLEPSLGYKQQGSVPGKSAPGRYMNWLFNLIYSWCVYLDDLHNSSGFLSQSYTWLTGVHRFTNGVRAAGVSLEGANEVVYTDASGVAAPKTRSTLLRLDDACGNSNLGLNWSRAGAGNIYAAGTSDSTPVQIRLPQGAVINSVRAWVDDGGSGTISMSVYAVSRNPVSGAISLGSPLGSGTETSGGAGALEDLEVTGIATTVDNTDTTYEVIFVASTTSGNPVVNLAYVVWTDPGPRND
jgi:hypothetical protein